MVVVTIAAVGDVIAIEADVVLMDIMGVMLMLIDPEFVDPDTIFVVVEVTSK